MKKIRRELPSGFTPEEERYMELIMTNMKTSVEIVREVWPHLNNPIMKSQSLSKREDIRQELLRRREIEKYRVPYTEQDIIIKLLREADDFTEPRNAKNRIDAIIWLGKHIGMFIENKEPSTGNITYNIIDYKAENPETFKRIAEDVKTKALQKIDHDSHGEGGYGEPSDA